MAVVLFTGPDEVFQGNQQGAQYNSRHNKYDEIIQLAVGAGAVRNTFKQCGLVLFTNRTGHACDGD